MDDFEQFKISALKKVHHIQITASRNVGGKNSNESKSDEKVVEKKINTNFAPSYGIPVRYVLKERELQRQAEVKSAIQARLNKFNQFSSKCTENVGQEWVKKQQTFINGQLQCENKIINSLNQYDQLSSNKQEKLNQYYQNLEKQRKTQEEELKAKENKQKILRENVERAKAFYVEFCGLYPKVIIIIKSCGSYDELKKVMLEELKRTPVLREKFEEVIKKCRSFEITEVDIKKAADVLLELKSLKEKFEGAVNGINAKINEAKQAPPPPPVEVKKAEPVNVAAQPQQIVKDELDTNKSQLKITQFVGLKNLTMYTALMDFLEQHSLTFKDLLEDVTFKQFKFDCKKAINIPVNAISAINSSHIMDKYDRLHKLLSGQTVYISDQQINATKHPKGIPFCMDLLAKKFVLQGDLMISSNPESAFCYATIISSLWNDFPLLGNLILAYMFQACPYLVPYYIPQNVGESDEEFYQRRGYQYVNGQVEKQDKFLKRMTGIMRLYCALLITKPKRGQTQIPHNLQNGWRWLVSILKLEPQVDITATMLHVFLESAGFAMEQAYGAHFKKILRVIVQQFLPSCSKKCTGGAGTRLELLMTEYTKKGKFEKPNGYTPTATW
ncbi:unnamed protein product [Brassicogethes aeneus]|uniref:mRNA export factor GLE1 n=1 Tax=Brassicogethes aeneus TaxID=1431903 RepID=A0A9P0FGE4_BRAAE|nr:unnamed protein product [Brassicogethes aeneus]